MKIKRLLGFVAIAVASVGILAACGKAVSYTHLTLPTN